MEKIELREEIYDDIHKVTPSWWVINGTYIVCSFVSFLLLLSYFIKYPDIILANAKFASNVPSITLPAKLDTKISTIIRKDGEHVQRGDYILIFQDNCNYLDILKVKDKLLKLNKSTDMSLFFFQSINQNYNLGTDIQKSWNSLMTYLLDYCQIVKYKKLDLEIDRLSKELILDKKIRDDFEKIISYNSGIRTLVTKRQSIDSLLKLQNVMSKGDYDEGEKKNLEIKKGFIGEELSYDKGNLELQKIVNNIDALKQSKKDKLSELEINIQKTILDIRQAISSWENDYTLKTPVNGRLNYLLSPKENLHVVAGEDIAIVTPDSMEFISIIQIPFVGAGKVKLGQKVHFKLNDYPYAEYGIVTGRIEQISNVANKDFYLGKVALDNYKITDYKKKINIKENTQGIAEIIITNRSWLGRLFENTIYIFTR